MTPRAGPLSSLKYGGSVSTPVFIEATVSAQICGVVPLSPVSVSLARLSDRGQSKNFCARALQPSIMFLLNSL